MNKLISATIGGLLLVAYVTYTSFVLYELRTTNAVLVEMTKIQQTMLSQIEYDVLPMRQFRGLTANRSFSCRIGDASAP
jgi:hypothetical protein